MSWFKPRPRGNWRLGDVTPSPKGTGVQRARKRIKRAQTEWKHLSIEERRKRTKGMDWTLKTERTDTPLPFDGVT